MATENFTLDTAYIQTFLSERDNFLQQAVDIMDSYDGIVKTLLADWVGSGAEGFEQDAQVLRTHAATLYDNLKTVLDTLQDAYSILAAADTKNGSDNNAAAGAAANASGT